MKKEVSFLLLLLTVAFWTQAQERTVKGRITDGKEPLSQVTVQVLEKGTATLTDVEGSYSIRADKGDLLQFSYVGLKTVTIKIEDVTRYLNLVMVPNIQELSEVTVRASKRKSQADLEREYRSNKRIINTTWGYIDADRTAGQVWMMNEEDINPGYICILDLLNGRFPGIRVFGSCTSWRGGVTLARRAGVFRNLNTSGFSSTGGLSGFSNRSGGVLYDIDGVIYGDTPFWLPVGNIRRLGIYTDLTFAARYGTANGVIVINTFNGTQNAERIVDLARLRDNYMTEKVLDKEQVVENSAIYLKQLAESTSFESSKQIFEGLKGQYRNSPFFILESYRHFSNKWEEYEYADSIINENFWLLKDNPVLLKALAYSYESQERLKKAHEMYKEVFILRPEYAQSYRDLANSYRNIGEPKLAASLYNRYNHLVEREFLSRDSTGFSKLMEREYNNLLNLEKNRLFSQRSVQKMFVENEEIAGTRMVFEWNDSEAEFELQFVNPDNQYFTWHQAMEENGDEIERQKTVGYSTFEEVLDESLPGLWSINVKYLGNKSLTPTYLKATVYYDYGQKGQQKEVKVFKLNVKNVNQELFKTSISGSITTQ